MKEHRNHTTTLNFLDFLYKNARYYVNKGVFTMEAYLSPPFRRLNSLQKQQERIAALQQEIIELQAALG